jgi:hypothetical protein
MMNEWLTQRLLICATSYANGSASDMVLLACMRIHCGKGFIVKVLLTQGCF